MKPKKITKEGYIKTYCQDKVMRNRKAVYISSAMHKTLEMIVNELKKDTHITLSSYVNTIIIHHVNDYMYLLKKLVDDSRNDTANTTPPQIDK